MGRTITPKLDAAVVERLLEAELRSAWRRHECRLVARVVDDGLVPVRPAGDRRRKTALNGRSERFQERRHRIEYRIRILNMEPVSSVLDADMGHPSQERPGVIHVFIDHQRSKSRIPLYEEHRAGDPREQNGRIYAVSHPTVTEHRHRLRIELVQRCRHATQRDWRILEIR
jgi:hypothetical protein